MTLRESIDTCLKRKYFFNFRGRASRSEFWWFMLFIFCVNLGTGAVSALLPAMVGASVSLVVSLLLLPANLGVTVRRLHDRDLSGWWLLVPVGCLIMFILMGPGSNLLANTLSFAMSVGYLIILCMPSQPGPNKYGEQPLSTP